MIGQCLHGVGDVEGGVEGELDVDPRGLVRRGVGVKAWPVEAKRAKTQVGRLVEQIEQLGGVKTKVAVV